MSISTSRPAVWTPSNLIALIDSHCFYKDSSIWIIFLSSLTYFITCHNPVLYTLSQALWKYHIGNTEVLPKLTVKFCQASSVCVAVGLCPGRCHSIVCSFLTSRTSQFSRNLTFIPCCSIDSIQNTDAMLSWGLYLSSAVILSMPGDFLFLVIVASTSDFSRCDEELAQWCLQ